MFHELKREKQNIVQRVSDANMDVQIGVYTFCKNQKMKMWLIKPKYNKVKTKWI